MMDKKKPSRNPFACFGPKKKGDQKLLQSANNKIQDLENEVELSLVKEAEKDVNGLKELLAEKQQEVENLKKTLQEEELSINAIKEKQQGEVATLQEELNNKQNEKAELEEKLRILMDTSKQESQEHSNQVNQKVRKLEEDLLNLRKELDAKLEEENANNSNRRKEVEEQVVKAKMKMQNLQEQIQAAQPKLTKAIEDLEVRRTEVIKYLDEIDAKQQQHEKEMQKMRLEREKDMEKMRLEREKDVKKMRPEREKDMMTIRPEREKDMMTIRPGREKDMMTIRPEREKDMMTIRPEREKDKSKVQMTSKEISEIRVPSRDRRKMTIGFEAVGGDMDVFFERTATNVKICIGACCGGEQPNEYMQNNPSDGITCEYLGCGMGPHAKSSCGICRSIDLSDTSLLS